MDTVADLNRDCYHHFSHLPAGFPEVRKSSRTRKMHLDSNIKSCLWLHHRTEIINLNCSSNFPIMKFTDYIPNALPPDCGPHLATAFSVSVLIFWLMILLWKLFLNKMLQKTVSAAEEVSSKISCFNLSTLKI